MKKTRFLALMLLSLSVQFAGNVFAQENNIDLDETRTINSDYEVSGLLNAIERGDASLVHKFDGMRVKLPNNHAIYVVENGKKRWIKSMWSYKNLFSRDCGKVHVSMYAADIPTGQALYPGAHLIQNHNTVFILDNGKKRHVVSPAVMSKFCFDWGKIRRYPNSVINSIPTGRPWR